MTHIDIDTLSAIEKDLPFSRSSKHCVRVEESQLGWLGCFGWAGKSGSALGLLLTDFG